MPHVQITISTKHVSDAQLAAFQKQIKQTTSALKQMQTAAGKVGPTTQRGFGQAGRAARQTAADFGALAKSAGVLSATVGFITKGFFDSAVAMERMMFGLSSVSGGAEQATSQLVQLREIAKLPGLALKDAVIGATRLQAVRIEADLAQRALMAVGNAVAMVGKGPMEFQRVLTGLVQIQSKNRAMMEEIRQIQEHLPQVYVAMKEAFGTTDTDVIAKAGISARQFILGVITELEKLPRVGNTAFNSLENLGDAVFQLQVALGNTLLPVLTTTINAISDVAAYLTALDNTTRGMIAWGGVVTTAIAGIAAAMAGVAAAAPHLKAAITALGTALAWLATPPWGPIVLVGAALAALVPSILAVHRHFNHTETLIKNLTDAMDKYNKSLRTNKEYQDAMREGRYDDAMKAQYAPKNIHENMSMREIRAETVRLNDRAVEIKNKLDKLREEEARLNVDLEKAEGDYRTFQRTGGKPGDPDVDRHLSKYQKLKDRQHELDLKMIPLENEYNKVMAEVKRALALMVPSERTPYEGKPTSDEKSPYLIPLGEAEYKKYTKLQVEYMQTRAKLIKDEHDQRRQAARIDFWERKQELEALLRTEKDISEQRKELISRQIEAERQISEQKIREIDAKEAEEFGKLKEKAAKVERKEIEQTSKAYYEAMRLRAQLVTDSSDRERQIAQVDHREKLADLQREIDAEETSDDRRRSLRAQIEAERELHIRRLLEIERNAERDIHTERRNVLDQIMASRRGEVAQIRNQYDQRRAMARLALQEQVAQLQEQLKATSVTGREQIEIHRQIKQARAAYEKELTQITLDESSKREQIIKGEQTAAWDAVVALHTARAEGIGNKYDQRRAQTRIRFQDQMGALTRQLRQPGLTGRHLQALMSQRDQLRTNLDIDLQRITTDENYEQQQKRDKNDQEMLDRSLKRTQQRIEDAERYFQSQERLTRKLQREYEKRIRSVRRWTDSLVSYPFDLIRARQQQADLEEESEKRLRELNEETARKIKEIEEDRKRSARDRIEEIEELEEESARRRKEIEEDLAEAKKDAMDDVFDHFLQGTLRAIEQEMQQRIAAGIVGNLWGGGQSAPAAQGGQGQASGGGLFSSLGKLLSGGKSAPAPPNAELGQSSGGLLSRLFSANPKALGAVPQAGLAYVAANSLKTLWQGTTFEGGPVDDAWWEIKRAGNWLSGLVGFDVPRHDRLAREVGRYQGMNLGRAHRLATQEAFQLGERSSRDLVAHHQRGFASGAGSASPEAGSASPSSVQIGEIVMPVTLQMDGEEFAVAVTRKQNVMARQGRANVG